MIRHQPSRTTTDSDSELGVAAVLLLLAVVLAAVLVPAFA